MPTGGSFGIGELSLRSGFTPKTLRYYDEIRLLVPRQRNPASRFRLYGPEALQTLRMITLGKEVGLSLKEIAQILAAARSGRGASSVRSILEGRRSVLDDQIRALRKLMGLLRRGFPSARPPR